MTITRRLSAFFQKISIKKFGFNHRNESGQGMVELAFSLIVILVVLAGIVDISRTITTKMQLQDAAEEGVVYAMAFPHNCTQIQYRVLQNLSKVKNATLSSIVITYNNVACATATGDVKGQLIKVYISNSFPVSMPFLGVAIGSSRTIQVDSKGVVIRN
jgi:Flp pilus assembly protein TadG